MKALFLFLAFFSFVGNAKIIKKGDKAMLCGDKPNCVSSLEKRPEYKVEPLKVKSQDEFVELVEKINKLPRVKLESFELNRNEAHFVFTSALFRFKDDVHLLYEPSLGVVHIKSQSRVGYSDLGANKKRYQKIKSLL